MEAKELKITVPAGHEIDWQESAKQEKIVFKKIDNKPRSWEEYCEQQAVNNKIGYCINSEICTICEPGWSKYIPSYNWCKNILPSKELAQAFLAMMQLMSLRQEWIGDWKPDWRSITKNWCVVFQVHKITVDFFYSNSHPLSFSTEEMAKDFMNTFKDLLNVAKPLI